MYLCIWERERAWVGQGEVAAERDWEVYSLMSRKPDMGLDPRILTEIMTRDKGRYMCKIPFFWETILYKRCLKKYWGINFNRRYKNLIDFCKATGIQMMGIPACLGCGPQSILLCNILFSSMSTNSSPSSLISF